MPIPSPYSRPRHAASKGGRAAEGVMRQGGAGQHSALWLSTVGVSGLLPMSPTDGALNVSAAAPRVEGNHWHPI